MKIALVYDMIYPHNIGGAEIRNYELARRLGRKHEVHLFGVKLWDGPDVVRKDGLVLHGVCRYGDGNRFSGKRSVLEPLKFAFALFRPILSERFDVIDSSAFPYLHCFTCWIVSRLKGTPLVITWHQWWGTYWRTYVGGIKGFFGEAIERLTVHLTKNHVSISNIVKNELVAASAGESGVFVNYDGVDLGRISSLPAGRETYDILFVGRFAHQKNISLLVEAVGILTGEFPSIRVLLVGDGPDMDGIRGLTKELGLEANITFTGLVADRDRVYSLMKSAKVLVLPSLLEGFGVVVAEAKACGLPAIVTDNKWNASKELIDGDGLVVEGSPESLASAIRRLLTDESLRSKMGRAALGRASSFSWDRSASELERYYAGRTGWKQG